MPFRVIITAAKTVSRARAEVSRSPASMSETMKATSSDRDRDRLHQGAEALAHAVRYDLGVMHRREHARHGRCGNEDTGFLVYLTADLPGGGR